MNFSLVSDVLFLVCLRRVAMDTEGELKFVDTAIGISPVLITGSIVSTLNVIPQGDGESQRLGRSVLLSGVALRYTLSLPEVVASATLPDGDTVRRILYIDHQCNGAAAVPLDVLETASIHSFYNLSNRGRFTILSDEFRDMVALSTAITPGGNFNSPSVHSENVWAFDLDNVIEFDGVDGTIDEMTTNNLGILYISHDGVAETGGFARIRYSSE